MNLNIAGRLFPSLRIVITPNLWNLSLMEWETSLLGRKIGRLAILKPIQDSLGARENLKSLEREAESFDFELLMARVPAEEFKAIWALERAGFILVDVGVTFRYELVGALQTPARDSGNMEHLWIRDATIEDIPALQEIVTGFFLTSYYYVSPFFSQGEADTLFRVWISNSVRGATANRVLIAELDSKPVGFVTCRVDDDKSGTVDLIGVRKSHASRGIGNLLIQKALECLSDFGVNIATLRTQITNIASINLSLSMGSRLSSMDITFMKSLRE